MCPSQSSHSQPPWRLEENAGLWRLVVNLIEMPVVDLSEKALHFQHQDGAQPWILPVPDRALPVDTCSARVRFSKRRGELSVEWPRSTGEKESKVEAQPAELERAVPEVVPTMRPVAEEAPKHESNTMAPILSEDVVQQEEKLPPLVASSSEAGQVIVEEPAEPVASAEEWKARGNASVKASDYEMAATNYSAGLATAGLEAEAETLLRSNRALCFQKLEKYESALADASRCVELSPSFVKGYLRAATSLRALSRPTEALAFLRRAPVNDECVALAAVIRPESEAAEAARIGSLPPAEKAKEEGNALFRKGLFEAAALRYTDALEHCGDQSGELALVVRNNRAACRHQISDFTAVIEDTSFVLMLEPTNAKALSRRMLALEALERIEQAVADARMLLLQEPRHEAANKLQHRLSRLVRETSREVGA